MKQIGYIPLPKIFNWNFCLKFLGRDPNELLFRIQDQKVRRIFRKDEEEALIEIAYLPPEHALAIYQLAGQLSQNQYTKLEDYVSEWFDLKRDLGPFVALANDDEILGQIVPAYRGLRLIGIPDLLECIAWAIIGQQINLVFAYKLKNAITKLIEQPFIFEGFEYYHFPSASEIAKLDTEVLRSIQFSRQKAEYIRILASEVLHKGLSKENLINLSPKDIEKRLTSIKGVGTWTSDYTRMKCLGDTSAYLIGDVGLQNALKRIMGLQSKPSKEEMLNLAQDWKGWEAYATFYLWYYLLFEEVSKD